MHINTSLLENLLSRYLHGKILMLAAFRINIRPINSDLFCTHTSSSYVDYSNRNLIINVYDRVLKYIEKEDEFKI